MYYHGKSRCLFLSISQLLDKFRNSLIVLNQVRLQVFTQVWVNQLLVNRLHLLKVLLWTWQIFVEMELFVDLFRQRTIETRLLNHSIRRISFLRRLSTGFGLEKLLFIGIAQLHQSPFQVFVLLLSWRGDLFTLWVRLYFSYFLQGLL